MDTVHDIETRSISVRQMIFGISELVKWYTMTIYLKSFVFLIFCD